MDDLLEGYGQSSHTMTSRSASCSAADLRNTGCSGHIERVSRQPRELVAREMEGVMDLGRWVFQYRVCGLPASRIHPMSPMKNGR